MKNLQDDVLTPAVEEVPDAQESFLTIKQSVLDNFVASAKSLKDMEPAVKIKMEYKRFQREGDTCRGIFLGFNKIKNGDGVPLDSIVWVEQDGVTYYHSGVILVDDVRKFGFQPGTPFQIQYIGKKKKAMDFDVRTLRNA